MKNERAGKSGPDISNVQSCFGQGESELSLKDVQSQIESLGQVCNVLVES